MKIINRKSQDGFALYELARTIVGLSIIVAFVWIIIHFVLKFW